MLVVVGGHSRNLGKTSLVAGLIRKFRERNWTALKITQYGHHCLRQSRHAMRLRSGARRAVRTDRRV
jgi:molybdopterin-guanine dinucleotide biosynthesis protein